MRIVIEAFGEEQMSRVLLRFAENATSFRPAFAQIRQSFYELEQHQFDTQGEYSGGWPELKPATLAAKLAAGFPPDILVRTGRLRDSLTHRGGDSQYIANANSMTIRSKVPYGVYHQSTQPRRFLPRRPPVTLPESAKVEWIKIIQHHITGGAFI